MVHEIAHMWFGDSVSLELWPDIWLNEGFATWSEWIYSEKNGARHAAAFFDELYAIPEDSDAGEDLWFPAPNAIPGPAQMFHTPVYDRGAMTLQALREKVGDDTFFSILRTWYAREPQRQRDDRGLHRAERADQRPAARRLLPRLAVRGGAAGELVTGCGRSPAPLTAPRARSRR